MKKIFFLISLGLFSIVTHAVEDIAVMGLIADKAILRIDGVHRVIKLGEEDVNSGLRVLKINPDRKSVTLEIDGISNVFRLGYGTDTGSRTVNLPSDPSGMYRTEGKINGKPVTFIIDTGATYVSLNKNIAEDIGIDFIDAKKTGTAETANGLVKVYFIELDSVEIGDIKLSNINAVVHDSEFPNAVLLGMSFLNQVNIKREGNILSLEIR